MDLKSYVDEIKLRLTGNLLELEIDDETIVKVIYSAFREIQRYIDLTVYETMPYKSCINLSPRKVNAVAQVLRAEALSGIGNYNSDTTTSYTSYSYGNNGVGHINSAVINSDGTITSINSDGSLVETDSSGHTIPDGTITPHAGGMMHDPIYLSMWAGLGSAYGYGNYGLNNYVSNYLAYNTAQQIRNTISTDLAFRFDRSTNLLYINVSNGIPNYVTIKYIPRFDDPSEIYSDYWIDMIVKMSVAMTKVILGRIRSRFTQSNALWTQDGDTILSEGKQELDAIRAELKESTQLFYPVD